jgi:hypothetical protein
MDCKHEDFKVLANIARCTRSDDDPTVVVFYLGLRVWCMNCRKPFEFVGLPMGLTPGQPRCSVDGEEARMPIKHVGESMPIDIAGFGVEFHEAWPLNL